MQVLDFKENLNKQKLHEFHLLCHTINNKALHHKNALLSLCILPTIFSQRGKENNITNLLGSNIHYIITSLHNIRQ